MTLEELFRRLSLAELSNLSMSNSGNGSIKTEEQPRLAVYINDGVEELHERFVLREKLLMLSLIEGKSDYELSSDFAVTKLLETPGPHYILDSENAPFTDDLLKILEVTDNDGCRYKLNVANDVMSLFTPSENVLQVPYPKPDRVLAIAYQAKPEQSLTEAAPTTELGIPAFLVPALRSYVAAKVYSSKNTVEAMSVGQKHQVDYENQIQKVMSYDLLTQGVHEVMTKFAQNGWV